MLSTLSIGDPKFNPVPYMCDGASTNILPLSIPYHLSKYTYSNYYMLLDRVLTSGAEGKISLEWCGLWELLVDFISDYRRESICVIASKARTLCCVNHYINVVHSTTPKDWYAGFTSLNARVDWFKSRFMTKIFFGIRVNDYPTRLRSVLNRIPISCKLWIIDTVDNHGECTAMQTFTLAYPMLSKGNSVILMVNIWDFDSRLLWIVSVLFKSVSVKVTSCGPWIGLHCIGLLKDPLKGIAASLETFTKFAPSSPYLASVNNTINNITKYLLATPVRVTDKYTIVNWLSQYDIPHISSSIWVLDPDHIEDTRQSRRQELGPEDVPPEFTPASTISDLMGSIMGDPVGDLMDDPVGSIMGDLPHPLKMKVNVRQVSNR